MKHKYKKVTWRMVYTTFEKTHPRPRLLKMACRFQTYNHDTWRVNFKPVIRPARKRQIIL